MRARTMFIAAASAGALAGGARPAAGQQARTITLPEAIQLATRDQPVMVTARQDVRIAAAQERQSRAAFLPSINASLSTSTAGGSRVSQFGAAQPVASFYSSSFGLSASWDVFTGFRRGAARRSAVATSDQRDATLRSQEYATILATQQAFFLVLASSELVTVEQTRLRSADEQLKLTTEKLRLGATTRSDSLRAQVAYGQAQLALITAQNNLRTAQANLARQIQVEGLVSAVPDSSLYIRLSLDTASLMRDAMANAPSVRAADAGELAARAQRNVAKSAYLPTATLSFGNTWAAGVQPDTSRPNITPTTAPFSGTYASGWTARFTVTYPLFNNLQRETNFISSDASLQEAVSKSRDTRYALSASLTQYLAALDAAAAKVDVATLSVAAAQEDLRMQRERYRLGAVTIIEVLTSQGNLDQAQTDLVQSRYDYLNARAQIEALVGHRL